MLLSLSPPLLEKTRTRRTVGLAPPVHALQIPVSVLKSSMLFRVDVRRTFVTKPAQTAPGEDAEPQFYVGPRAGERSVPEREQTLARQACRELLPGSDADAEDSPGSLVAGVAEHLADYAAAVAKLRGAAGLPDHLLSRGEPPAPVLDQSCVDKHPLCESWAARVRGFRIRGEEVLLIFLRGEAGPG